MSKKDVLKRYLPAASHQEIAAAEAKLNAIKKASRKPRKLKVEPVTETVIRCIAAGKSSRLTVKLVRRIHNYEIGKDSVLRFARSLPPHSAA